LKLVSEVQPVKGVGFQSDIHQNKDWNWERSHCLGFIPRLSERHPPKQGLKPTWHVTNPIPPGGSVRLLSERHPPKQGLKLEAPLFVFTVMYPFRATSTKTRIETL